MASVHWSEEEKQTVIDEALRLRDGGMESPLEAFAEAQRVLPKNRRRNVTASLRSKALWFVEAWEKKPVQQPPAETRRRIVWNADEQKALCREAARLIARLEAGSRREALMKAQDIALPPERRRHVYSMTSVNDWFSDGLMAAAEALRREAAEAPETTPEPVSVAPVVAEPVLAEPEPTLAEPAPVEFVAAPESAVSARPSLPAVLATPWAQLREFLVNEIASIVGEGIQRGLASVQLLQQSDDQPTRPHVPFVRDGQAKVRRPSVLVAGLKESQAAQIEADFGKDLDLRFCTSDQSKDQLRLMTERADTTVAVTDFLSHSHTDIIKARARSFVPSAGGMTHLRQELAKIAAARGLNGTHA